MKHRMQGFGTVKTTFTTIAGAVAAMGAAWQAAGAPRTPTVTTHPQVPSSPAYRQAVAKTAAMVDDREAQRLAKRHGLDILNLTWEDTGRYGNSSVGPNISDMTIQVATREARGGQTQTTCMPVIRYPNFSDKTCDLDPRDFTLLVGNQRAASGKVCGACRCTIFCRSRPHF